MTLPKTAPYMTVVPLRRPERKAHLTRGHANSALSSATYGYHRLRTTQPIELYQWHDGAWTLIWSAQPGDEITGTPWKAATL